MTTFTYLLVVVAVVAALSGRAECRPQTPETRDVEAVAGNDQRDQPVFYSEHQYGTIAGEVTTSTGNLFVAKRQKKKPRSGPSVSALVAGPPEVSVGVSAGLSLVPSEAKVEVVAVR
ncbi:uncharacterized protein LOC123506697 [Portunus trituberculatus]|uniref:uncharacterized protein LOC123506697 n=1 Tax=Portunus trituberculatus TaxID=210409 RepID=UPI001E1CDC73|nr:uncharacterized protein LOC123506697 [Portunus trituberculatus]